METSIMHDLPEFKAADLTRHTSDLFDAAIRSPIAITKHRKPKFVLMSMDQYQQLTREATQQAHMVDEMPEDLKSLMIEGLERDLTQADD
ncbi:type II toxin-antitoxin system Phd/YefM family antitoxin [Marivita cryptomonadis]|uniref:Antitoxin n=3 Tax=Rhodobacterales TaxID=204455 RepID=A0A9Q2NUK7_9RHOB|nr:MULTISPECIES: type II toxin-antitoxin system prevent-host-death family antitoxin [Roseobacteraceae]MBM2323172.1 type II toxin-antitoxin system Phd/YefM family antitoxin [Marivita cryptomonadis]MBO9439775.1 type II toxin-antitoxin system Phd/YefM family antitoxin [Sulfitobacter sp. R18_2]MBM2332756.1 type II toxin-antitoxin system Phd/YefM family antitoxin [Marivita cryptomonadis]MBM2342338.1 type II toxin-antitoxin system Phd/YefM family antitoxin [Marivita cryptomonadis]MBM2347005.1 type I